MTPLPPSQPKLGMLCFFFLFCCAASAMLWGFGKQALHLYRAEWEMVQGKVVSGEVVRTRERSGGRTRHAATYGPRIVCRYEVGGQLYEAKVKNFRSFVERAEAEKLLAELQSAEALPIAYNVADPVEAYYEEAPKRNHLGGAIILSQVVIAFWCIWIYQVRKWQKARREKDGEAKPDKVA